MRDRQTLLAGLLIALGALSDAGPDDTQAVGTRHLVLEPPHQRRAGRQVHPALAVEHGGNGGLRLVAHAVQLTTGRRTFH